MNAENVGVAETPVGFIETFRSVDAKPLLWKYHQRRLRLACDRCELAIPKDFLVSDVTRLQRAMDKLLADNRQTDGVFRYVLNCGARDRTGHRLLSEALEIRELPKSDPASGIELHVLRQRRDRGPWIPRPKSLDYANTLLGLEELRQRTQDEFADGLFLHAEGNLVVEAIYRNVGWIDDGKIFCPEPGLGAVAGTCLEWIGQETPPVIPVQARLDDLLAADAVFVCNSVRGVSPVRAIRNELGLLRGNYPSVQHPLIVQLKAKWKQICPDREGRQTG